METDSFANRLQKALIIRDMKPIDLARKSGLNKAIISQYLSGRYKAKQDNIYILSKALNINEAWLMGYDVTIDRTPDSERTNIMLYTATDSAMLPLLDIGDIAHVIPQDIYESKDTILFKLDGKETIRKIVDYEDYIELHAMNPYFPVSTVQKKDFEIRNFILIGKVIKAENASAFK